MTAEEVVRRVLIALAKSNMIRPGPSWPPFTNLAGVSAGDLTEAANLVAEHARESIKDALARNNLLRWVAQAKRVVIDGRTFKDEGRETVWMSSDKWDWGDIGTPTEFWQEEDRRSVADPEER